MMINRIFFMSVFLLSIFCVKAQTPYVKISAGLQPRLVYEKFIQVKDSQNIPIPFLRFSVIATDGEVLWNARTDKNGITNIKFSEESYPDSIVFWQKALTQKNERYVAKEKKIAISQKKELKDSMVVYFEREK